MIGSQRTSFLPFVLFKSFTIPGILKGDKPWADPEIGVNFTPRWNEVEESGLDRRSYEGSYLVEDGYPLNPVGRTGLKGRGSLGKWGPNHAADCIVTRQVKTRDGWIGHWILSLLFCL